MHVIHVPRISEEVIIMREKFSSEADGCAENRMLLSRRGFIGGSAALFSGTLLPEYVSANRREMDKRLLIVVLRGGVDGLSVIVPHGDSFYEEARQDLAIPTERLLLLDPFFGLHPSLQNLNALFASGEATIIPAAGLPVQTRSHFECQLCLESGLPSNSPSSVGWVNRLLSSLPRNADLRQRGAIAIGARPAIIAGPAPALSWSPTWFGPPDPNVLARIERMYHGGHPDLATSLANGIAAERLAGNAGEGIGANLTPLQIGFRGAGRLLGAAGGPQLAVLSVYGWDTHNSQGNLSGQIVNRLSDLDEAIGEFRQQFTTAAWQNTAVICVTEFGRAVQTNGTSGTDHGVGMPVILVGGALNGGIRGDWPGLEARLLLDNRDLRPTVDLRSVFKGTVRDLFGIPQSTLNNIIFPDSGSSAPPMNNLIREVAEPLRGRAVAAANVTRADAGSLQNIFSYRDAHGAR